MKPFDQLARSPSMRPAIRGRASVHRPSAIGRRLCMAVLIGAALLLRSPSLQAAAISVDSIYPAGGQRGSTVTVTASGKFDSSPLKIWCDTPSLQFEPAKKPGVFSIKIPADAPLGPHLIRLYSDREASPAYCFVVGADPESIEAEPNDEFAKAQPISALPALVNGQLGKSGDVDCYAFDLQAGQTLVASVQGRRLGSAIDPMLHLLDGAGVEMAYAQDGLGLDPLLVFRAVKPGRYIIRISAFAFPPAADVRLAGGKEGGYRLHLTVGPFVLGAVPAGVARGANSRIRLYGYNLVHDQIEVDSTHCLPYEDHLSVQVPGPETPLRIGLSTGPEIILSAGQKPPSPLVPPFNISGTLAAPHQEDRFDFAVKKGDRLGIVVRAQAAHSPLDAIVRILGGDGKAIATNDDPPGPSHDPRLDWDVPRDGVYSITLADIFRKSGPDYRYRLEVGPRTSEISGTVDIDASIIEPGKSAAIKIRIARQNNHTLPMIAAATHLPPGVTATSAPLPAASGDVTLTLSAAADCKPFSGPIRLMLLGTDPGRPWAQPVFFNLPAERDKAGSPEFIEHTPDVWITVPRAQAPKSTPAKK